MNKTRVVQTSHSRHALGLVKLTLRHITSHILILYSEETRGKGHLASRLLGLSRYVLRLVPTTPRNCRCDKLFAGLGEAAVSRCQLMQHVPPPVALFVERFVEVVTRLNRDIPHCASSRMPITTPLIGCGILADSCKGADSYARIGGQVTAREIVFRYWRRS